MASFDLIRTDGELLGLVQHFRDSGPARIAVDIEGENNLHSYGIHVALIQLFDGNRAFLIDAPAIRNKDLFRALLSDSDWLKVMFDTTSDMLAFHHSLAVRPAPILDLAIAARLLGLPGGLDKLVAKTAPARSKSRLQRSNWLRRPISKEMLEYAVSDVLPLLDLADSLMSDIAAEGLMPEFTRRNSEMQNKNLEWNPFANFTRIPGFERMSRANQEFAKTLWCAREYYGRKRNVPPDNVATKVQLRQIIDRNLRDPAKIVHFLNIDRKRIMLDAGEFADRLEEADREGRANG